LKKNNAILDSSDNFEWILNEKIRIHFSEMDASHELFKFGNFTADFSSIEIILSTHSEWANRITFNLNKFAKHLFFESIAEVVNTGVIRYKYEAIIKTIYYIASKNIFYLDESTLADYYIFLIMHGVIKNKVEKRPSALSYQNFMYTQDSVHWCNVQEEFQYPKFGYFSRVSDSKKNKAIRSAVLQLFDGALTLEEWRDGGSFNSLTLDYGQYYVHHCIDFFDSNFILAAALKKTLDEALSIAINAGLELSVDSLKSYGITTICQFLAGASVEELSYSTKRKSHEWNKKVHKFTLKQFQKNYHLFNRLSLANDMNKIKQILIESGKDPDDSNSFLLVQGLVQKIILRSFFNSSDIQFQLLDQDISLHHLDLIGLSKLEKLVNTHLKDIKKVQFKLTNEYFDNLGVQNKSTQATYIHSFLRLTEHTGITKIVALTGWRESEYGFSLNDFKLEANADTFDSSLNACRYEITGLIPKTHGGAKVSREVTSDIFISVLKQSLVTLPPKKNDPCLYSVLKKSKNPNYSREHIKYSVTKAWVNYVYFYKPFLAINKSLEAGTLEVDNYDPLVLHAHKRAYQEITRVGFFLEYDNRRKLIWRYKNRDFPDSVLTMIDQYLSESTKLLCQSFNSEDDIHPWHSEHVMSEILGDCLYPTPHALRHLWAEAVLRRFDGDVGWAIRSHFKHLSSKMWRRYVTNKDNQRIYTSAKHNFINAVLNNYAISKGQGYAGPTQKLLRRLVSDTKAVAIEDLQSKLHTFGTNIVSIHSNPWGFCVLRNKHQSSAKCAENGEPNRQNASPGACLGCRFNLIQTQHIDGILLNIENDIKVLKHDSVPEIFYTAALKTVKLANESLIHLNADAEIIAELKLLQQPRLS
jgi:hypothetical protein